MKRYIPIFLLLISYFSFLPAHAQCDPGDAACGDIPINQTDIITQPYNMTPYDYSTYKNRMIYTASLQLTSHFFDVAMINGLGRSGLTVWYMVFFEDPYRFISGFIILMIALAVFFWFAGWVIERRSSYRMAGGYTDRVRGAQSNVDNFNQWASNPYNEDPDLLDQQDPKEWQRAYNSMQRQQAKEQRAAERWHKKQEKEWAWAARHYNPDGTKKKGK